MIEFPHLSASGKMDKRRMACDARFQLRTEHRLYIIHGCLLNVDFDKYLA